MQSKRKRKQKKNEEENINAKKNQSTYNAVIMRMKQQSIAYTNETSDF